GKRRVDVVLETPGKPKLELAKVVLPDGTVFRVKRNSDQQYVMVPAWEPQAGGRSEFEWPLRAPYARIRRFAGTPWRPTLPRDFDHVRGRRPGEARADLCPARWGIGPVYQRRGHALTGRRLGR